jgi:RNA polymerase sigma factor (TIGR02999 family)
MGRVVTTRDEITNLLAALSAGNVGAQQKLFERVYRDLRRIAKRYLASERRNHTLQATALVHEAYLRISGSSDLKLHDPEHFFALAARAMRRVLIDHARSLHAEKRTGSKISLESAFVSTPEQSADLVALDEALERLATWDPRQAEVVEMRFLGGLSVEEIAAILNVSQRTVKRDWSVARAWLYGELTKAKRHEHQTVAEA